MIRQFIFSLLITAFASHVFGQANAVITGPTEVKAGNLVVLNSSGSTADQTTWLVPDNLKPFSFQVKDFLVFAVNEAGTHEVFLVAVTAEIDETGKTVDVHSTSHTVKLIGGSNPGDGDDDGGGDDPPPTGDFESIRKLCQDAARSLSDPTTAKQLADAIDGVKGDNLESVKRSFDMAVEDVLLMRKGASRDVEWAKRWRQPIIDAIDVRDGPNYRKALAAVASGLRSASTATNSINAKPRVVMRQPIK